jgi:hypothetical protein
VTGPGKLSPQKEEYQVDEAVVLNCKEGYEPAGKDRAVCTTDGFCPSTLECVEIGKQELATGYSKAWLGYFMRPKLVTP